MKEPDLLHIAREHVEKLRQQGVLRQRVEDEIERSGRFDPRLGYAESQRILEQGDDHFIYKVRAFSGDSDMKYIAFDSRPFARVLEVSTDGFAKVYELEPRQTVEDVIGRIVPIGSRGATEVDLRQFGELLEMLEAQSRPIPTSRPKDVAGGHEIMA